MSVKITVKRANLHVITNIASIENKTLVHVYQVCMATAKMYV